MPAVGNFFLVVFPTQCSITLNFFFSARYFFFSHFPRQFDFMYLQLKSASHERHCLIVMSEVFFSFYLEWNTCTRHKYEADFIQNAPPDRFSKTHLGNLTCLLCSGTLFPQHVLQLCGRHVRPLWGGGYKDVLKHGPFFVARAQASVMQAKTLGWCNRGGGEPHTGMRLCSTHRLVNSNKNWPNFATSQIWMSKLSREAGCYVWCLMSASFVCGFTLHRSRRQRPRPRARPKRRRDDNLHRHVSPTSGRVFRHVLKTSTGHFYVSSVLVLHDLHMGRDMHIEIWMTLFIVVVMLDFYLSIVKLLSLASSPRIVLYISRQRAGAQAAKPKARQVTSGAATQ